MEENGHKRFLIPSLLNCKGDSVWIHFDETECPYSYMMGRICVSSITLNPCTVAILQHSLGKHGKELSASTEFFQAGLLMLHEEFVIIMTEILMHQGICVKIGIRKDLCGSDRNSLKKLIIKCGKLLDDIFTKECCAIVEEKNPSPKLERSVLSLDGMLRGNDTVRYQLTDVIHKFKHNIRFIFPFMVKDRKGDRVALLLTESEKRSQNAEV